jgi:phosphoglycerate dehydrogenase-like enzyme
VSITILVSHPSYRTAELSEQIKALAPNARIVSTADIQADARLLPEIEVVLGRLPADLFAKAVNLKWVHTSWAGAEWLDNPEMQSAKFTVTNSRIHDEAISEHLFAMLLMLTRRLNTAFLNQQRRLWQHERETRIEIIAGKTLCVVGLGVIGRRCAALGQAFNMRVIGIRHTPQPTPNVEAVYGAEQKLEALAQADVVILTLPFTAATNSFIGSAEFKAMRQGVYFLNAGRGKTVDTEALLAALRDGTVKGAGIDTVEPEPLPPAHPLWDQPNVIISPHVAGDHPNYVKNATAVFITNLRHYLAHEPLEFVVDKQRGY